MEKVVTKVSHAGQKISNSEMRLMLNSGIPLVDFEVDQIHPLEIKSLESMHDCYRIIEDANISKPSSSFKKKLDILDKIYHLIRGSINNPSYYESRWSWTINQTRQGYAGVFKIELSQKIKNMFNIGLALDKKNPYKDNPVDNLVDMLAKTLVELLYDIKYLQTSTTEFFEAKYHKVGKSYLIILPCLEKIELSILKALLTKCEQFYWLKQSHPSTYTVFSQHDAKEVDKIKFTQPSVMQKFVETAEQSNVPIHHGNSLLFPSAKSTQLIHTSTKNYSIYRIWLEYFENYKIAYHDITTINENNITYIKNTLIQSLNKRFANVSSNANQIESVIVVNLDGIILAKFSSCITEKLIENENTKENINSLREKIKCESSNIVFRGVLPNIDDPNLEQSINNNIRPFLKIENIGLISNSSSVEMLKNFKKHNRIIIEEQNLLINVDLPKSQFNIMINMLLPYISSMTEEKVRPTP